MYTPHHPPHLFLDNYVYFITAKTTNSNSFFYDDQRKKIFVKVLNKAIEKFTIKIFTWVLLDNHYHLLMYLENAILLSKFIQNIHMNSARLLNVLDQITDRQIWWNYWDRCIRSEKDFWMHFNYIHHNPIKHGYFKLQDECQHYSFCGYKKWLEQKGEEWLLSCFATYPIRDFTLSCED